MATGWRQQARRVVHRSAEWGRRLGLLPYRPEERTSDEWTAAYDSGSLDYYAQLAELGRYSGIVGYIQWSASGDADSQRCVLDVGCGSGLLRRRLSDANTADYVGIDLSDAAIETARQQSFDRAQFVVGDVMTADLGRSAFDVVVLNEVLYYAPDATAFLERIRALLNEDGSVVISMWRHPGDRTLWKAVDTVFRVVDRVEIRNRANSVNPRGWIVACCRARN
jgi:2-polyprenyl-3-methyl-5-hydroxy-6-metoxy-1,4-benzoquinol methylase